jgi:hypothetical protein
MIELQSVSSGLESDVRLLWVQDFTPPCRHWWPRMGREQY